MKDRYLSKAKRICDGEWVLDYIRSKKITDSKMLDILLCHCQNKLNGNIDGIELDLDGHLRGVPFKKVGENE